MKGEGRFGKVPLVGICEGCTIESPLLRRDPICCSSTQVWEGFYCMECGVRGLLNVSLRTPTMEMYRWSPDIVISDLWMRDWEGWDA